MNALHSIYLVKKNYIVVDIIVDKYKVFQRLKYKIQFINSKN